MYILFLKVYKMKRILLIVFAIIYLSGCRSFYINQAIKAPDRQYTEKLPTLEPVFENEQEVKHWIPGEKLVRENSHWATLFYREVDKNIINSNGSQQGYIVLRPIIHQQQVTGGGWTLLSLCTLYLPNFIGMPFASNTAFSELELDILNKNGELIKRYSAESEDTEYVAMWWGYNEINAPNAAMYNSYRNSLGDLVKQVMNDREYLIQQLK